MRTLNKTITHTTLSLATVALLSACGGGGGSGGGSSNNDEDRATAPLFNVALDALVTSTFSGNESFVADGDTSDMNFWKAGDVGDSVTLHLGGIFIAESARIYSANLTSNTDFSFELSADGINFTPINIVTDCLNLSLGASGYSCDLKQKQDVQRARLTILNKADTIEIYEIEIQGRDL